MPATFANSMQSTKTTPIHTPKQEGRIEMAPEDLLSCEEDIPPIEKRHRGGPHRCVLAHSDRHSNTGSKAEGGTLDQSS